MRRQAMVACWVVWALAAAAVILPGPAVAGRAAGRGPAGAAQARSGTHAQEVGRAALALQKLGLYKGDTDGAWTPELREAVRAFQKSRGLKTTGRLNRDTRAALGLEPPVSSSGKGRGTRAQGASGEEAP